MQTEQSYAYWKLKGTSSVTLDVRQGMGRADVNTFFTTLAVACNLAAAIRNAALSAILFLYREVLAPSPPWLDDVTGAKTGPVPTVLTRFEVEASVAASAPSMDDGGMDA